MSKLSEQEMGQWIAWKRATEAVMAAVVADITAQTGLSAADFSVLTRVVETPRAASASSACPTTWAGNAADSHAN